MSDIFVDSSSLLMYGTINKGRKCMNNNKCEYIHTTFIEMKRYESHYRHKLHVTALAIFIAES